MTCNRCKEEQDKVLRGDRDLRLIYFRVHKADMVMLGCEEHATIALRRYRLGVDTEIQHGGEGQGE